MINTLIKICDFLGVSYDENYLNSFDSDCKKFEYLLDCIYKFLGGE